MDWNIRFTPNAGKLVKKLEERIQLALRALVNDLETKGPAPGKHWPNYGKLNGKKQEDKRHCHLIKGKPTYVCCWEVYKVENIIEVYYVGTHEKAPY
jgi:mRNA-degrading endonuclease RelE of RelBE toxin-antitoxin system